MKVLKKSAWSKQEIYDYLDHTKTPMRLACIDSHGYPVICSLWFIRSGEELWAASHQRSHLVQLLQENPKVGFEIATNTFPYKGVRGQANVELIENHKVDALEDLVARYLNDTNQALASWLLSRSDQEIAIRIRPGAISAWDYSSRMKAD